MSGDRADGDDPARSALDAGLRDYLHGDLEGAAKHAEAALVSEGLRPLAHYLRALVSLELGEAAAAREDLIACAQDDVLSGPASRVLAGLDALDSRRTRAEGLEPSASDAYPSSTEAGDETAGKSPSTESLPVDAAAAS